VSFKQFSLTTQTLRLQATVHSTISHPHSRLQAENPTPLRLMTALINTCSALSVSLLPCVGANGSLTGSLYCTMTPPLPY